MTKQKYTAFYLMDVNTFGDDNPYKVICDWELGKQRVLDELKGHIERYCQIEETDWFEGTLFMKNFDSEDDCIEFVNRHDDEDEDVKIIPKEWDEMKKIEAERKLVVNF